MNQNTWQDFNDAEQQQGFDLIPKGALVKVRMTIKPGGHGLQGRDGRMAAIPKGGHGLQGRDGRMVAIPAGGHGLQGIDGRMVAIPKGKHGIENDKGRMQAKG